MDNICKICKNEKNNTTFTAYEKMLDLNDEFEYFECGKCGCLQIKQIPANIKQYYPPNYYSYNIIHGQSGSLQTVKDRIKRICIDCKINRSGFIRHLFPSFHKSFSWITKDILGYHASILDVGCGNGDLLLWMYKLGFKNLKGIDPYIDKNIKYFSEISIEKKTIYEESGQYDFIMLHNSFEHMDEPLEIFKNIYRLLGHDCYALIRVPVAQSYAWRKYKANWVQLDAPRHFFIHTVNSISILAQESNLEIANVFYDSTEFQFTGSEKYLRDIPFNCTDSHVFEKKDIKSFSKKADLLNRIKDGDNACFYLYKK